MLSRILAGARYTVGISLAAVVLACASGVVLGMTAAVIGGWLDTVLSRLLDALNSIPRKMFGLVVVAGFGSCIPVLIGTLAVIYMPGAYRFARALAVNINTMDYVAVARARGEGTPYLIGREILPNILGPVLADFGLRFVFIVLLLSGLSLPRPGRPAAGRRLGLAGAREHRRPALGAPAVLMPALAIASLTIGVNLLIDNLPAKIRDEERLMPNIVEIRDLRVEAAHRRRPYGGDHQGRQPRRRRRRGAGADRRNRLGQDHHRAHADGLRPPRLPHRRRLGPRRRRRTWPASPSPSARDCAAPRSPTSRRAPPPPSTRRKRSWTR